MFAPFHDPTRLRSLVLLVLLLLASFVPSARAQGTTRVATLLPFVEEALTRANPEDEVLVVASVRRSLREPVAAGLVDLGNPHSPNLEQLASARPALVVGDAAIHARLEEPVARLGARLMLLDTSMLAHGRSVFDDDIQAASLDHAMWFHRPFRADEWLLYCQDSTSSCSSRGFNRGSIYTSDGVLVASVAQEGLVRLRR